MLSKDDLLELVIDALELENEDINFDTNFESIEEFDSLGTLSVFTAISQKTK